MNAGDAIESSMYYVFVNSKRMEKLSFKRALGWSIQVNLFGDLSRSQGGAFRVMRR